MEVRSILIASVTVDSGRWWTGIIAISIPLRLRRRRRSTRSSRRRWLPWRHDGVRFLVLLLPTTIAYFLLIESNLWGQSFSISSCTIALLFVIVNWNVAAIELFLLYYEEYMNRMGRNRIESNFCLCCVSIITQFCTSNEECDGYVLHF